MFVVIDCDGVTVTAWIRIWGIILAVRLHTQECAECMCDDDPGTRSLLPSASPASAWWEYLPMRGMRSRFLGKLRLRANAADVVPGSPTTAQSNWPRQGLGRNRSFGQVRRKPSEFPTDSVRLPSSDPSTIPRRRYAPTCMMHSFRRRALALRSAALSPGRHMCPPLSTISALSSRMRSSLRYDLASAVCSDASNASLFLACGRSPAALHSVFSVHA